MAPFTRLTVCMRISKDGTVDLSQISRPARSVPALHTPSLPRYRLQGLPRKGSTHRRSLGGPT